VALESERAAILGDGADQFGRGAIRNLGLDFERDFDVSINEPRQMLDDFFRDSRGVAAEADGVELDGGVETSWPGWFDGGSAAGTRLDDGGAVDAAARIVWAGRRSAANCGAGLLVVNQLALRDSGSPQGQ